MLATITIPESHRDLLVRPIHGVVSTMMPDGQPQNSVVWVDYDGSDVLISTTIERQKGRNMSANSKATVLVVDPENSTRWMEVRGRVAEITQEGAIAEVDRLTRRYTGKLHFYGDVFEAEQQDRETRVTVRIEPIKVSLDAKFK